MKWVMTFAGTWCRQHSHSDRRFFTRTLYSRSGSLLTFPPPDLPPKSPYFIPIPLSLPLQAPSPPSFSLSSLFFPSPQSPSQLYLHLHASACLTAPLPRKTVFLFRSISLNPLSGCGNEVSRDGVLKTGEGVACSLPRQGRRGKGGGRL